MYKRVLLPISLDHPESWSKALPEASALVRSTGGELHLLSVVPDFGMAAVKGFFPDGFEEKALIRAQQDLDAFAAAHVDKDINCSTHLGHGSIAEHILRAADELAVDLIVIASHDPDRMRDFLIGSNADRIVHRATVSVLVTRG